MSTETAPNGAADAAKRRGQALGGAAAGVVILIVLVVVFILVKDGKSDKSPVAGSVPSAAAPASAPAAEPSPAAPVAVNTPAALAKEPEVKAGGKKPLTKLAVVPIVKGAGPVVQKGQTITANYKLVSYKTGEVIDSSWQGQPFVTVIGTGQVIPGFDQGIVGQKVGSRLQLDVPAALAYGDQQGDLRFVVDILAAQ
ncbi:FKBP-type peptidyl-prolyl cis-trans isomerase [Paractinoplanes globisporus]|uniref:Peptidyl-prolyl cis-trans isomerase n=1 Tax=Paractinoplanes globisporus TaxID=113565 RepID=A0ABW6WTT1_9ACTN|nr:FKBP-type peptidyl-prolyl cis-trans isomerase [Actinoplanes globisporus]